MKSLILSAMIALVSIGADSTRAKDEPPAPWVILIYECERPVGIMLHTDPPRWFPATSDLTPYVATQIRTAIKAKRTTMLIVGRKCGDKLKT